MPSNSSIASDTAAPSFYSSFGDHHQENNNSTATNKSNSFLGHTSSSIQDPDLDDERQSILLLRRQLEQVHAIRQEGQRKDDRLRDANLHARDLEAQVDILRTKLQVQACELERRDSRAVQNQQALSRAQQLANELALAHQVTRELDAKVMELQTDLQLATRQEKLTTETALSQEKERALERAQEQDEVAKLRATVQKSELRCQELTNERVKLTAEINRTDKSGTNFRTKASKAEAQISKLKSRLALREVHVERLEEKVVRCEVSETRLAKAISKNENLTKRFQNQQAELTQLRTSLEQETQKRQEAEQQANVSATTLAMLQGHVQTMIKSDEEDQDKEYKATRRASELETKLRDATEKADLFEQAAMREAQTAEQLIEAQQQLQHVCQYVHENISAVTTSFHRGVLLGETDFAVASTSAIGQSKSVSDVPDTLVIDIESLFRSQADVVDAHRRMVESNGSIKRSCKEAQQEAKDAMAREQVLETETRVLIQRANGLEERLQVEHDRLESTTQITQEVEQREQKSREELKNALGTFLNSLTSAIQQQESLACGCEIRMQLPNDNSTGKTGKGSSNAVDAMKLLALELSDTSVDQTKVLASCTEMAQHAFDVLWEEVHATHAQLHMCQGNVEATQKRVHDEITKIQIDAKRTADEAKVALERAKGRLKQDHEHAVTAMEVEVARVTERLSLEVDNHRFVGEQTHGELELMRKRCENLEGVCSELVIGSIALNYRASELRDQKFLLQREVKIMQNAQNSLDGLVAALRASNDGGMSVSVALKQQGDTKNEHERRTEVTVLNGEGNGSDFGCGSNSTRRHSRRNQRRGFRGIRVAVIAVMAANRLAKIMRILAGSNKFGDNGERQHTKKTVFSLGRLPPLNDVISVVHDSVNPNHKNKNAQRNISFWALLGKFGVVDTFSVETRRNQFSLFIANSNGYTSRNGSIEGGCKNQILSGTAAASLSFVRNFLLALTERLCVLNEVNKETATKLHHHLAIRHELQDELALVRDSLLASNGLVEHLEYKLQAMEAKQEEMIELNRFKDLEEYAKGLQMSIQELQKGNKVSRADLRQFSGERQTLQTTCARLSEQVGQLEAKRKELVESLTGKIDEVSVFRNFARQKEAEACQLNDKLKAQESVVITLRNSLAESQSNTKILLRATTTTTRNSGTSH